MEPTKKTPLQELKDLLLLKFKTVNINNSIITVSDGINQQPFCMSDVTMSGFKTKFDKDQAEYIVECIELNFKHIFDDEN